MKLYATLPPPQIKNLLLVGAGLIGGSLTLALKNAGVVQNVTGIGRRLELIPFDEVIEGGTRQRPGFHSTLQIDQGPCDLQAQISQLMRRTAAAFDGREPFVEHLKMRLQRREFTAMIEDGIGGGVRQADGEGVE